jgi:signal peptidase I
VAKKPKEKKSAGGSFLELVSIVAVALGLALGIQAFLVKPYRIPSESMVPTLEVGQRVLVNRIGNTFSDGPDVGQVVVFHPPQGADTDTCGDPDKREGEPCSRPTDERSDVNFIKRVVAGPGDRIAVREGQVIRNGRPVGDEGEYTSDTCDGDIGRGCDLPVEITVPEGHYFMMGDNRGESDDSRFWGPVPRDWIIGPAFATYWPPNRIGLL